MQPAAMETVVIDTTAWMRRPRMPRIPLEIRMAHRLGVGFVHDIRIGRGRASFGFGLDAYVAGHGIMRVGRSVHAGPSFDQGALVAMWGEALVFAGSWRDRSDVRWEAAGDLDATLIVPVGVGVIPISVSFDPATGLPSACRADRFKGDGPLTAWSGIWSDWRMAEDGALAPRRMQVRWMDEPEPWLDIRVTALTAGASVDDAMARARDVIRGLSDHAFKELEGRSR